MSNNDETTAWDNYRKARHQLDMLVKECEMGTEMDADGREDDDERADFPNPDDVLALDVKHHIDIMLGVGGPTRCITVVFDDEMDFKRAVYMTSDNAAGSMVEVEVSDDDAQTLMDAYTMGADSLSEMLKGSRDWADCL